MVWEVEIELNSNLCESIEASLCGRLAVAGNA